MSGSDASVLFDAPGPRARRTQRVVAAVLIVAALGLGAWVLAQLAAKGQLAPEKWRPLLWTDVWSEYLLPGILGTLRAAALSIVLAGVKGSGAVAALEPDKVVLKELTVRGMFSQDIRAFEPALRLIESRRYPLERLHTHTFGLEQAAEAVETLKTVPVDRYWEAVSLFG